MTTGLTMLASGGNVARRVLCAAVIVCACCVVFAGAPSPALAWGNGARSHNAFGTHDWVLYHANRFASRQGVSWVQIGIAERASDDPDTVIKDLRDHNYDRWGGEHYGNAAGRVAHYYRRAVASLRLGRRADATRSLALMSHYYADVCQPMHTAEGAAEPMPAHLAYERAVDVRTASPGRNAGWLAYDGYRRVSDPSGFAASSAKIAHGSYGRLMGSWRTGGFNASVRAITASQLGRAVNGLADLIVSATEDGARLSTSKPLREGVGIASDGSAYFVSGESGITKYTTRWAPLAKVTPTSLATTEVPEPRIGACVRYRDALYVLARDAADDTWILSVDPDTLAVRGSISATDVPHASAICVMPTWGSKGALCVTSADSRRRIYRYDLVKHTPMSAVWLDRQVAGTIHGITRKGGTIFVSTATTNGVGRIYSVKPKGSKGVTRLRLLVTAPGFHDTIAMRGRDIRWLVTLDGASRVLRYRLP